MLGLVTGQGVGDGQVNRPRRRGGDSGVGHRQVQDRGSHLGRSQEHVGGGALTP